MQSALIISLTFCCGLCFKAHSQDQACGQIIYTYDNAGNRIERYKLPCGNGGGGITGRIGDFDTTTNNLDTTSAISKPVLNPIVNSDSTVSKIILDMLSPNPTTGQVTVSFNTELSNANVAIYNNTGQLLYQAKVSGSQIPLDLTGYAQGIYFIVFTVNTQTFKQSVVKQD